ncbi:MAG: phosphopantothenate/pantothenate synthetase [Candidatus Thorarchaeota archaeon]
MTKIEIPPDHPRRVSLETRETIIDGHERHIVATAGLLAHGRGEAFDYLIGERTSDLARRAIRAAVAAMLTAKHPVISVNGNVCSLVPHDLVDLSELTGAPLEINLFYYRKEREDAILAALQEAGASRVLGTHDRPSETIPELSSNRRKVDPDGIGSADVVVVPLEDGDRTEALKRVGKYVITIDLNPMSRTAVFSDITIVDNIVRALPLMVKSAQEMRDLPADELAAIVKEFDNEENLRESLELIMHRLKILSEDLGTLRRKVVE